MSVRLSVIVATYQSSEWLEKVLWGYLAQTHRDFELLIADDGSTDETAQVIARYSDQGVPIRHVWQRDDGFRKSRILNKAIGTARAEYLVFSDGDLIPRGDFLAAHAGLAARGRFLSGGCVRLPMEVSRIVTRADVVEGRVFSVRWNRAHGGGASRGWTKLAVPGFAAAAADCITTTRPTWNGGNASGWRRDLITVNGFDERMGYGGQDRELGRRLENAGVRGYGVRYRALCVHLDHGRGYADSESIRRNKKIRRRTRSKRVTWTRFGIEKGRKPPESSSAPAPPGPRP